MELQELEKHSARQCTDQEIAGWFGVSTRTIEKRRKKPACAAPVERSRITGRISVRRAQMKMPQGGMARCRDVAAKRCLNAALTHLVSPAQGIRHTLANGVG